MLPITAALLLSTIIWPAAQVEHPHEIAATEGSTVSLFYMGEVGVNFELRLVIFENGTAVLSGKEYHARFGKPGYAVLTYSEPLNTFMSDKINWLVQEFPVESFSVAPSSIFDHIRLQTRQGDVRLIGWDGLNCRVDICMETVMARADHELCNIIHLIIEQSDSITHHEIDRGFIDYSSALLRNAM